MKKLLTITMLLFSLIAFSQTELKIKGLVFTPSGENYSDQKQDHAYGFIKLYENLNIIHVKINDKVDDIIYPLEAGKQEFISGLDTFTFRATSENGDKDLVIRFVENNIIMIKFSNNSVLTLFYGE